MDSPVWWSWNSSAAGDRGLVGSVGHEHGGIEIYRDIPEPLRELIEPVVDERGCELVDVELLQSSVQSKGRGLLRIIVDSPACDGRVPIERCVAISREVETLLDATAGVAETMPGAYQLEVSSPGLDRVLGREKDFHAAVSLEVKLRTRRPIEGRRRFRGRLVSFESGVLKLNVDGVDALIPFDEVEKANSIYEFTSADFAKKSSRRGSSQSGGI
jgi:ribosome maturation factor RimP